MTHLDYKHTCTQDHLAAKNWPDLVRTFIEVDGVIGPQARRLDCGNKEPADVSEPPPATAEAPLPPIPSPADAASPPEAAAQPEAAHPGGHHPPMGVTPTPEQAERGRALQWAFQCLAQQHAAGGQTLHMIQRTRKGMCHLGPAQGNHSARMRGTRNQRRRNRRGRGENHGEHELSQYEQEIMGLWEVAAQVRQDAV